MNVIETQGLRRSFGLKDAVRRLDLAVPAGSVCALLGPNGAGKTTTIKMLMTLLLPTAGHARVLGHDVVEEPREVRRNVGYVFGGDRGLYDRLNARDNLRYFSELYGVPPQRQRQRIDELIELVGLAGREDERVEGYSRGMRQRLHIARGLLHDPAVIFLDEPTIGIDPVGARELRGLIGNLKAAGKTVLLTTHYMFEADELCDRIAVIRSGTIVAEGTPQALKNNVSAGHVLEVEAYGVRPEVVADVRALAGVRSVSVEEDGQAQRLLVQVDHGVEVAPEVLARLAGTSVGRVVTRQPTLEDAYVELVGTTDD